MPLVDAQLDELRFSRSTVVTPSNVLEYWTGTIGDACRHPSALTFSPVASPPSVIEGLDVSFSGFGRETFGGWLSRPRNDPKRLPLVIEYAGFGAGRGFPHAHLPWAATGFAYVRMDNRGQGGTRVPRDTAYPHRIPRADHGLTTQGVLSRESDYCQRLINDAVRAVDTLAAADFVDLDRNAVAGESEGGGLALAVADLNERVTAVACDARFNGHDAGRDEQQQKSLLWICEQLQAGR